ncbi:hypothetical protein [Amycolatopsis dongchuanensis]|uniref:hypothetical protein n=1 Tax=Amycolatopsis TaxID=1813 RepID=UPI0031F8DE0F
MLAVVVALGATSDEEEPRRATEMHAKGALTTLEAAGLIEIDRAAGALTMGPAVATWTDQEVAVLRQTWSRLPEPPASDPSSSHARRPPVSAVSLTYQNTSSSTKDPATRSMERGLSLTALDQKGREHVLVAVRAIEEAEQPVPKNAFRALSDEALRASVERILAESGRVLLETREGFLSGYSDAVAHALTTTGLGVLPPDDRAVLALVLLHAVAIPRARGIIPPNSDWTVSESVPPRILTNSKLPEATIKNSLRRLRDAKILGYGRNHGVVPGPQFNRLTPQATESIFEELVLLSEPHGLLAESIRLRRQARAT